MKIQIQGYECLNKVAMTKAINLYTSLNLKESKSITDSLLESGFVEFDVDSSWDSKKLIEAFKSAHINLRVLE